MSGHVLGSLGPTAVNYQMILSLPGPRGKFGPVLLAGGRHGSDMPPIYKDCVHDVGTGSGC